MRCHILRLLRAKLWAERWNDECPNQSNTLVNMMCG